MYLYDIKAKSACTLGALSAMIPIVSSGSQAALLTSCGCHRGARYWDIKFYIGLREGLSVPIQASRLR